MKLPKYYDIYDHNKYIDKVLFAAKQLAQDEPPGTTMMPITGKENICLNNRKKIKELQAMLLHLELATEEILCLREQR